jgi:hypothetical protein
VAVINLVADIRAVVDVDNVKQFVLTELEHVKTLSMGTYQTVKEMPGYEDAISVITERVKEQETEIKFDPDLDQVPG